MVASDEHLVSTNLSSASKLYFESEEILDSAVSFPSVTISWWHCWRLSATAAAGLAISAAFSTVTMARFAFTRWSWSWLSN